MHATERFRDDATVASRYLAGQLSPDEEAAYEQYFLANPAAVQELEATARLKVGLANLRDTGQLAKIQTSPGATSRRWAAVAAVLALVVLAAALTLWRGTQPPESMLFAQSAERATLGSGPSYPLVRTRSSGYDALIELPPVPAAIELRVRPEQASPQYRATLSRIHGDGSVRQLAALEGLRAEADGFVRVYVDSSMLEPAPYLLVLSGTPEEGAPAASAFRLRVVPPAGQS